MMKKIKNIPCDLELSADKMREMGEAALAAVIDHIRDLPGSPRSSLENGDVIARSLKEPPPESGAEFSRLLEFLMKQVIPVSVNTAHPTFMGFIPRAAGLAPLETVWRRSLPGKSGGKAAADPYDVPVVFGSAGIRMPFRAGAVHYHVPFST